MLLNEFSLRVKQEAKQIGFDACGIAPVKRMSETIPVLDLWLGKGFHDQMQWMEKHRQVREDAGLLVGNAQSVVVCLLSYDRTAMNSAGKPSVARYAWGEDYHVVIKKMLHELLSFIQANHPDKAIRGRCFTDSAPIFERNWAVEAGLGWIGRNTMLINRRLGSYTFIGEIIIDGRMAYDAADDFNGCGECRRCMDFCPANAIVAADDAAAGKRSLVDARRCISNLTIEHKGAFSPEQRRLLRDAGNCRIFGCDACIDVCPWNKKARRQTIETGDHRIPERFGEDTPVMQITRKTIPEAWSEFRDMSAAEFDRRFGKTALSRAGRDSIQRNIEVFLDESEKHGG